MRLLNLVRKRKFETVLILIALAVWLWVFYQDRKEKEPEMGTWRVINSGISQANKVETNYPGHPLLHHDHLFAGVGYTCFEERLHQVEVVVKNRIWCDPGAPDDLWAEIRTWKKYWYDAVFDPVGGEPPSYQYQGNDAWWLQVEPGADEGPVAMATAKHPALLNEPQLSIKISWPYVKGYNTIKDYMSVRVFLDDQQEVPGTIRIVTIANAVSRIDCRGTELVHIVGFNQSDHETVLSGNNTAPNWMQNKHERETHFSSIPIPPERSHYLNYGEKEDTN